MSQAVPAPTDSLFDVVVKIPPNVTLEQVERQARAAGIAPERLEALLRALRSGPQVKIGSGVPRARADAARAQFGQAGLDVVLTPVLSLAEKRDAEGDGRMECPACAKRVLLPANRQCPECGVFVDKLRPEDLLRKKMMQEERARIEFQARRDAQHAERKLREDVENAMRAAIRKELEEEYGINRGRSRFSLLMGGLKLAGVAVLAAGAFAAGRGALPGLGGFDFGSATAATSSGPAAALDSLGPKHATAAAAGSPGADPDADDPLIRQAGGERVGAKGVSIEQAVGAAQKLAASVGNTTAQRALQGGAAQAPQGDGSAAGAVPAEVAAAVKTELALEFTRDLAELGQWPRAQGVVKALRSSSRTVVEPALATAAQALQVEVRAWTLQGLDAARARGAAEALLAEAQAVADPAARSRAYARAAAVVSRHPAVALEVPKLLLARAAEAARAVPGASGKSAALSGSALAAGEALAETGVAAVRAGRWNVGAAAASQLHALVGQEGDLATQAQLLAFASRLQLALGKPDLAAQEMARAVATLPRLPELRQRAAVLHALARATEFRQPAAIQAAAATLQAEAMGQQGLVRAGALLELAVLHAEAGAPGRSDELAAALAASTDLQPAEAAAIGARLIVRRELAAARLQHAARNYSDAELTLRRVGDLVL